MHVKKVNPWPTLRESSKRVSTQATYTWNDGKKTVEQQKLLHALTFKEKHKFYITKVKNRYGHLKK